MMIIIIMINITTIIIIIIIIDIVFSLYQHYYVNWYTVTRVGSGLRVRAEVECFIESFARSLAGRDRML